MSTPSPYPVGKEEKPRVGRFTSEEIDMLGIFRDNDVLLKILRQIFFQQDLGVLGLEIATKAFYGKKGLIAVLHKWLLPCSDDDSPIEQTSSVWTDRKYADLLMGEARVLVLARQDLIKFLEDGLFRLETIATTGKDNVRPLAIDLDMRGDYSNSSPEETKRAVVAFTDSIIWLDGNLNAIKVRVNTQTESDEERTSREERQRKDSTK